MAQVVRAYEEMAEEERGKIAETAAAFLARL
jgi:hypothetical protein